MMHQITAHILWLELHTEAKRLKSNLAQKMFMLAWMAEAKASLGCSSCWQKVEWFCQHWPVAYGKDLWLWSICLHDYVNKELGKPLFYPQLTLAPLTRKGIIQ